MELTHRERDCLVFIGNDIKGGFPDRLIDLSKKLKVKPPTTIQLLDKLESKALISRKGGMVILTDNGKKIYHDVTESHRIIEVMLYSYGIPKGECCEVASEIDYVFKHDLIERLSSNLGNPKLCPHGNPVNEEL